MTAREVDNDTRVGSLGSARYREGQLFKNTPDSGIVILYVGNKSADTHFFGSSGKHAHQLRADADVLKIITEGYGNFGLVWPSADQSSSANGNVCMIGDLGKGDEAPITLGVGLSNVRGFFLDSGDADMPHGLVKALETALRTHVVKDGDQQRRVFRTKWAHTYQMPGLRAKGNKLILVIHVNIRL